MVHDQRSALSAHIASLLSAGQVVFTRQQAEQALGVERGAFLDAAERLQRRKALIRPRQGLYVAVPPQFASWGAPPPSWYIDALMRHELQPYYVGLLKAAELHGATHQAVMEFQIVTPKRMPKIKAGRNLIVFYYRKDIAAVEAGIEDRKTDTGRMKISSPALTALDLLRYPQAAGGIDNVATVLMDLAEKIDPSQLAVLSDATERPVVQRLGYLLERLGHNTLSDPMHSALMARGATPWTELDRHETRDPDFTLTPQERDDRWHVIVRRAPEVDE
ncbi:type IV toxin-antitoxin system AbiEi family antitoxin domain-containing protein [Agrobacterium tumefaciens]|uniref:type IV toxin-antitoxin system AbiEi family antitoxin domain-containing protein n=1 Tax=Agrobacterium tumefaciens TaxID=358 RepID=UPI000DDDB635|nr:type IV toxin-antitoxin system AbiEi family antitoxin [Agrobacterium tumefaciens]MBP2537500.1 putative transcriptional regulator of viral defense system [Agrobacterium tumefaciens]MDP9791024.1 putative transcriptional regulator of viral defense system [Agrobacterium tumefaciens]